MRRRAGGALLLDGLRDRANVDAIVVSSLVATRPALISSRAENSLAQQRVFVPGIRRVRALVADLVDDGLDVVADTAARNSDAGSRLPENTPSDEVPTIHGQLTSVMQDFQIRRLAR